jgi:chromosomal replication initiator protein
LIVDDVQLLINKRKTQVEFLHTFSSLVESGRQIVLASDVPPRALQELDAGLVGRFLSGLVVGIRKPDYATRLGILRGQASRLPTRIDDGVLKFLAESVRGSVRELLGALMKLDIHAQLNGGSLGFEDARDLLSEFERERRGRVNLAKIRDVVAQHYEVRADLLVSRSRQRHVVLARQVAMHLARRHTEHSLAEIGKFFGRRNHTTVRCAELKIAHLLDAGEASLRRDMSTILEQLDE